MTTARIKLPPKLIPVFAPARGALRYRGAYGGRGSAKSFSFAKMAAIWGYVEPLRILCTRDLQGSIKESFHAELKNAIESEPWLSEHYDVGVDYLRGKNGTDFLFKGLRHNISSIKSTAQIDLCIVEEAEDVQESSWLALEPTIRSPKSEIWTIWNPKMEGSATDRIFRKEKPGRSRIVEMNYSDNPFFPTVLEELRLKQLKNMDPETYAWIWEGAYLKNSNASIFRGAWRKDRLIPDADWHGPYLGLDFGFSNDPTAGVECWISPDERTLYIAKEAGQIGLELDDTAKFLVDAIPAMADHPVYADCARPESISYLARPDPYGRRPNLPRVEGVSKGKGSVEDGIAHIKSFDDIVIDPDCTETITEFMQYSYKIDRLSGDVLPVIVDKYNHYIDAIRYALEKVMIAKESPAGILIPQHLLKMQR